MAKFILEDLDFLYDNYRTLFFAWQSGKVTKNHVVSALKRYARAARKLGYSVYDDYKYIYNQRMEDELQFFVKEHRKMWRYIADNISENRSAATLKYMYLRDRHIDILNYCFLCEYSSRHINSDDLFCSKCPLKELTNISCLNGKYDELFYSDDLERRRSLAKEIAELPVVNRWWLNINQ